MKSVSGNWSFANLMSSLSYVKMIRSFSECGPVRFVDSKSEHSTSESRRKINFNEYFCQGETPFDFHSHFIRSAFFFCFLYCQHSSFSSSCLFAACQPTVPLWFAHICRGHSISFFLFFWNPKLNFHLNTLHKKFKVGKKEQSSQCENNFVFRFFFLRRKKSFPFQLLKCGHKNALHLSVFIRLVLSITSPHFYSSVSFIHLFGIVRPYLWTKESKAARESQQPETCVRTCVFASVRLCLCRCEFVCVRTRHDVYHEIAEILLSVVYLMEIQITFGNVLSACRFRLYVLFVCAHLLFLSLL